MATKKKEKVSEERVIKTDYPKPSSYSVRYDCNNCGWHGTILYPKGRTAPSVATCPTCDCATAKKSVAWPARIRTEPVQKDPIIPTTFPKYPLDPWPIPNYPGRRNDERPPRDPWPGYPVRPWNEIDNLPDRYREVLEPRIYVSNASQRDLYD